MSQPPEDHGRLQAFDIGPYARPNQPYSCGQACEGVECLLGPTPRGRCQAGMECQPITKNEKWICGRASDRGGKCEEGPSSIGECCNRIPPCAPIPSLRLRRGRFVVWCATAAIGVTLLTLAAPWRDQVLSPGEMTQEHAQILNQQNPNSKNCAACHAASESGLRQWTVATVLPHRLAGATQSEKVLEVSR